ncbi:MAG: GNAT family N-acetyltransferase, partial [Bacteroidales bacterium]|nr:GNAT family N-acetyltransferase [Bacteroidales bacterium]MBN2755729.1 GNAT family N-acetyltransferase [Bacteroidales bacterium]
MQQKVTIFYLEMTNKNQFIPKIGFEDEIEIKEIENDEYLNFVFFTGVGLPFKWYSRLKWNISEWQNYFKNNNVKTYLGFHRNKLIGYYELEIQADNNIEIMFFGLLPNQIGKALGSKFLSHAINSSWKLNPKRIYLHTCSIDHQFAYQNYVSRGFELYKQEDEIEDIPSKNEFVEMISNYYNNYIDRFSSNL